MIDMCEDCKMMIEGDMEYRGRVTEDDNVIRMNNMLNMIIIDVCSNHGCYGHKRYKINDNNWLLIGFN